MTGRLVVVSGTGTGIGKTHFAEALLLALRALDARVAGLKPIETGLGEGGVSDAQRLDRASTFHVKQIGYTFSEPVSPHLAARREGRPIEVDVIVRMVDAVRRETDLTLVELPGGLFSPLGDDFLNANMALALRADDVLLVAPDRLGVLHEVIASTRAATSVPLRLDGLVLATPAAPDGSTGDNAAELGRLCEVPVLAVIPRAPVQALASHPALRALAESLGRRLS